MRKPLLLVLSVAAACAVAVALYINNHPMELQNPNMPSQTPAPVSVSPIEHASVLLDWGGVVMYADPVGDRALYDGRPAPRIILVTDIHRDHFSTSTLAALAGEGTVLVVPPVVMAQLSDDLRSRAKALANGQSASVEGFEIRAVPMYNLPESADAFHIKGRGNGYVISRDGFDVYLAGDTSGIPEMRALVGIDIAFVPMNLPYTMTVDEAADAVIAFKPKQVYPYHYRGTEGLSDVNRFRQLVEAAGQDIDVILANWYPRGA